MVVNCHTVATLAVSCAVAVSIAGSSASTSWLESVSTAMTDNLIFMMPIPCLFVLACTYTIVRYVGCSKRSFGIWIIPHTCEVTNLQDRSVGDQVNLEPDMLGKYVEKFTGSQISQ